LNLLVALKALNGTLFKSSLIRTCG